MRIALAGAHTFRGVAERVSDREPEKHTFDPREVWPSGHRVRSPEQEGRIPHTDAPCGKQRLERLEVGGHITKRIASQGRSGEVKCPYRASAESPGVRA